MNMKNNYTIEFFHGQQGIWKSAGGPSFTELDKARAYMKAQSEMTGGCVDFRIESSRS